MPVFRNRRSRKLQFTLTSFACVAPNWLRSALNRTHASKSVEDRSELCFLHRCFAVSDPIPTWFGFLQHLSPCTLMLSNNPGCIQRRGALPKSGRHNCPCGWPSNSSFSGYEFCRQGSSLQLCGPLSSLPDIRANNRVFDARPVQGIYNGSR